MCFAMLRPCCVLIEAAAGKPLMASQWQREDDWTDGASFAPHWLPVVGREIGKRLWTTAQDRLPRFNKIGALIAWTFRTFSRWNRYCAI